MSRSTSTSRARMSGFTGDPLYVGLPDEGLVLERRGACEDQSAMHATAIFFPGGVRLSTWLTLLVFLGLTAWRADVRPFLACLAWLWGFEAVYQIMCILTGNGSPASSASQIVLIGFGVVSAAAASVCGVFPSWPVLAAFAAVWVVWVAVGLPASLPDHFNAQAEVLNELAKILFAAAWLVPLFTREQPERDPLIVAAQPRS